MSFVEGLTLWLRALFNRRRVERDLDREMQFHLEMEIEQRVRDGASPADARREARLAFGGVDRHKEAVRDERGTRLIEEFLNDVRLATRSFAAKPFFTATAVITMAIGIGAATAVFSIGNWIFLRPVPGVVDPRSIMRIDLHTEHTGKGGLSISPSGLSYPNLLDLQRAVPAFRSLAAASSMSAQLSGPGVVATSVNASGVIEDYFGVLGVRPQIGRLFTPEELKPGGSGTLVVLSDRVWRSAFNADSSVVGRVVRVNGVSFTVAGVAQGGFRGIDRLGFIDAWVPATTMPRLLHNPSFDLTRRLGGPFSEVIGRVVPGATSALAEQQLRATIAHLIEQYPVDNEGLKTRLAYVTADLGLVGWRRPFAAETVRMLGLVVGLVLLISCANAANLLLLRGVRRRAEVAVRRALGASSSRLLRQHAVEGLVLSVPSAVSAIALTLAFRTVLRRQAIPGYPALSEVPIDWRVLAFAVATACGVSILFALLTSIPSLRSDLVSNLKDGTRLEGRRAPRLRRALTVVQIAACMSLAVASALFARTLRVLNAVDLGFDPSHVSVFGVDPSRQGYDSTHIRQFQTRLVAEVGTVTGVDGAAVTLAAPFASGQWGADVRRRDYSGTDWPIQASRVATSPQYFSILRIPLIAGDPMPEAGDALSDPSVDPVVISRSLAHALFGNANAIGQQFAERGYGQMLTHTVVGVAADVHMSRVRGEPDNVVYSSPSRFPQPAQWLIVRARGNSAAIDRAIRQAIARADPLVPVFFAQTMDDAVANNIASERLFSRVLGLLGALTALLTAAGIYGIIAYGVAERTREIGLRVALGAERAAIVSLVTKQLVAMIGGGLVVGTAGSIALSRLLSTQLYGVTPSDPSSYVAAAIVLVVLGLCAAIAPARAALHVNPVDALRHE